MNQQAPERFRFFFKVRGLVMIPPLLFVLFCRWGEADNRPLLLGIGCALFCAGVLIRVWAQMHLHYRLPVKKILTTTGPYRLVRNPFYVANTVILLSLCVLSGLLWFLPIMLLYCAIVYSLVVGYEESHLRNKYGAPYEEFLATVPRWLPRFSHHEKLETPHVSQYLWPGIKAELHNLLFILPFLAKQILF